MVLLRQIFLAFSMACLLSSTARADPPPASHDHWRNTNYPGHYVLYDNASHTWVETVDCRVFYRFTVVSNERNTLTLFDASRGMTVRLDYTGMWLKPAGATTFSFYQNGTFDTRTMFDHQDANGVYTGTIRKGHACVWSETFPGGGAPAFTFVQTTTTGDSVELYDRSRDLSVKLVSGSMWLKQGSGPYNFFKNGHWH